MVVSIFFSIWCIESLYPKPSALDPKTPGLKSCTSLVYRISMYDKIDGGAPEARGATRAGAQERAGERTCREGRAFTGLGSRGLGA